MIFGVLGRHKSMSTPTVKEITRRMEPVVHDDFIDDLRVVDPRSPRPTRKEASR
jgi:hypothetical protein